MQDKFHLHFTYDTKVVCRSQTQQLVVAAMQVTVLHVKGGGDQEAPAGSQMWCMSMLVSSALKTDHQSISERRQDTCTPGGENTPETMKGEKQNPLSVNTNRRNIEEWSQNSRQK